MIALGWTMRGASPVPGTMLVWSGKLDLLVAEVEQAASARQRMALQLACLRSCDSFLPLSPSKEMTPIDLQGVDQTPIHAALGRLSGQAQLTLGCALTRAPQRAADSGRAWLADRRQSMSNVHRRVEQLQAAASAAPHVDLAVHQRAGRIFCDMLLPMTEVSAARAAISARARALWPDQTDALTLTGPWPAYSFTPVLQRIAA